MRHSLFLVAAVVLRAKIARVRNVANYLCCHPYVTGSPKARLSLPADANRRNASAFDTPREYISTRPPPASASTHTKALSADPRPDRSEGLDRKRDTLPTADAQRHYSALQAVAHQRVKQASREDSASCADRVPMRNRATLNVNYFVWQTDLLHYG
jgi:hypothetical protein